MKKFIYSLIFCAVLLAGNGDAKPNGFRIYGGEVAERAFPYIVRIDGYITCLYEELGVETSGVAQCGGSIITPYHILTAAHCIEETKNCKITEIRVVAGANYIGEGGDGTTFNVAERHPHPEYKVKVIKRDPLTKKPINMRVRNDIAILELKQRIGQDNENIRPICLATDDKERYEELTILGWGKREDGESSEQLITATVQQQECPVEPFSKYFDKNKICVSDNTKGVGSGDSGGPLVANDDEDTPTQVGVVSCGAQQHNYISSTFTRVSDYVSWIEETIEGSAHDVDICTTSLNGYLDKFDDDEEEEEEEENLR